MNLKNMARGTATLGKLLIAASLFFALIWWWVSVSLFAAGLIALGLAWLIDGAFSQARSVESAS